MQMTLWVIPDAFVDDVLRKDLPFLASLTRGAMEAMMMKSVMVEFSAPLPHLVWVKNMQMTLWVIHVAFVDDDLREGLPFLASSTRGAIEAMMMKLVMVVAMGCFAAASASLQWSIHCLILNPP
jgi:hypothetical protein